MREEVRAEALVRNHGDFARFLEVAAFSHGAELNLAALARECDLTRRTAEGYLGVVEDLLLDRAKHHEIEHEVTCVPAKDFLRHLRPEGSLADALSPPHQQRLH